MATSVIGYPLETYYCPQCGSADITPNDMWHQDGLMVCENCGCRCYIIQAEEEEPQNEDGKLYGGTK